MVARPFLSRRFMEQGIPKLRARGFATRMGIDGQMITLHRRGAGGSFVPGPTVEVVVERAGNRQELTRGHGTGAVETTLSGELSGWAPLPVQKGDRFEWGDQTCQVSAVMPEEDGIVTATFTLLQTGPGVN